MTSICQRVVDYFVKEEVIKSEDADIYILGVGQSISLVINIFTIIGIAVLLDAKLEALIFSAFYYMLRSFAGGIHAKSPLSCYLYSLILIFVSLLTIKYMSIPYGWVFVTTIVVAVFVLKMAPVENISKPLDKAEKDYFKRVTCKMVFIELIIFVLCYTFQIWMVAKCVTVALVITAILLILEKLRKKLKTNLLTL